MIKSPSLQSDYPLCFSEDCALDLPALDGLDGDALDVARAERRRRLDVARNTGNWAAITKPGERPTVFLMRPLYGVAWTWLRGQSPDGRIAEYHAELAFRLTCVGAENFGKWAARFDADSDHRMLTTAALDEIYSIGADTPDPDFGRRIVMELGLLAIARARDGVRPL